MFMFDFFIIISLSTKNVLSTTKISKLVSTSKDFCCGRKKIRQFFYLRNNVIYFFYVNHHLHRIAVYLPYLVC
ncbi:hypothetical protein HERIO_2772 [Hepatospora eriocheir]|uniref:Secreted protein n=1 Tax=Hepatospora eriocheir TaxID=1081669 RepID=A0A1X0Q939_9MICR|nr:hypothetical protein HERIO_2772 [Hepatospora eriocheir]